MRATFSSSIESDVKIVILAEAQRQFETQDDWWREHRDANELFVDEFEQTLALLSSTPEIGRAYRRARGKLIQRMLMKSTRFHVYYFHDRENDLVEIHSVWGAVRGRGPAL